MICIADPATLVIGKSVCGVLGLKEVDYVWIAEHSLGLFLVHEGDQTRTAHVQYNTDIIWHTLHSPYQNYIQMHVKQSHDKIYFVFEHTA